MTWYTLVLWIPICFFAWIELDPDGAIALGNQIRAWWRGVLIRKVGTDHLHQIQTEWLQFAKQNNIPQEEVKAIIEDRRQELIQALGKQYIDRHEPWLNEEW